MTDRSSSKLYFEKRKMKKGENVVKCKKKKEKKDIKK